MNKTAPTCVAQSSNGTVGSASSAGWSDGMQFILGVIFFVCVVGMIDARLPWPKPRSQDKQQ